MNNAQSALIMKGMIDFIETQGRERVAQIDAQMETEFTVTSEQMIQLEKNPPPMKSSPVNLD